MERKNIKFEVCCGSAADAYEAYMGGADRIELNSALFLGGLTPSLGELIKAKEICKVPIMCMVRPREGGFCYSTAEYETMKLDAQYLLEHGADGLVFGFLNPDGTVDERRTDEFKELCRDKEAVFSRAIDLAPDIPVAVRLLDSIGIDRVLTSGGKPSAPVGKEMIKAMLDETHNMQILPGGGIKPENVKDFIEYTSVDQVHASSRKVYFDTSASGRPEIFFGGMIDGKYNPENICKISDREAVAKMKKLLSEI